MTDSLLIGKRVELFKRDWTDMPDFISYGPNDEDIVYDRLERNCSLIPLNEFGTVIHYHIDPRVGPHVVVHKDDGHIESFRIEDVKLISDQLDF